jgi:hypothetical protein
MGQALQMEYRGHGISFRRDGGWTAELTELETGTLLPTKATAAVEEGITILSERARQLIDIYVEAQRPAAQWPRSVALPLIAATARS